MATKPKLGQNFLSDAGAIRRISDSLGDLSQSTVVEIGPGRGAITRSLAARCRRLVAVELDVGLASNLRHEFAGQSNVEIIEQDVLSFDFFSVAYSHEKIAVVGNLPYYITSDILLHLFRSHEAISQAVVMMQREVADRVAAIPGTRDYGLLSATAQLYARVQKLFTLPPGAFSPSPEVHSTVLRLNFAPRFEELKVQPAPFLTFLRQAFAQKRKTLANNLRAAGYSPALIQLALTESGIPALARAEGLSLEQDALLFQKIEKAAAMR